MTELPNKIINNCQGSFYKNRAVKEMHEINKEHIQIYIYIYIYIYISEKPKSKILQQKLRLRRIV